MWKLILGLPSGQRLSNVNSSDSDPKTRMRLTSNLLDRLWPIGGQDGGLLEDPPMEMARARGARGGAPKATQADASTTTRRDHAAPTTRVGISMIARRWSYG